MKELYLEGKCVVSFFVCVTWFATCCCIRCIFWMLKCRVGIIKKYIILGTEIELLYFFAIFIVEKTV
jgi:hypothetical protein